MSRHYPLPQSARAEGGLEYEPVIEEESSPSSSTFTSSSAETEEPHAQPTSPQWRRDSEETLAAQSLDLGHRVSKGKPDASALFLSPQNGHGMSRRSPSRSEPDAARLDRGWYGVKRRIHKKVSRFWASNRCYLLVIFSTIFGTLMTLFAKILESEGQGMHVFQILFSRMAASWVICAVALYYTRRAEFPFGPKEVRWLLIWRGISGFVGIATFWTALNYVNLSDATVITFLTPSMIAGYSAIFLNEPFPKKDMAATCVALLGVVFIARPVALFGKGPAHSVPSVSSGLGDGHPTTTPAQSPDQTGDETRRAADRLLGIALCILSAIGGTGALLSVKRIGTRASVLTTTLHFAITCTVVTGATMLLAPWFNIDQPQLHFALPRGGQQWLYVGAITGCGLATQLLMTLGVGGERRSSRAPAMLYTGMLWTAGFDRLVFGKVMHWTSVVGCGLIVGGAVFIALQPKPLAEQRLPVPVVADVDEENQDEWIIEMSSISGSELEHP